MAKEKMTLKRAKQVCTYGVGYCNLQYLFNDLTPYAYVYTHTYGWRCDLYDLGGIIISMGYTPVGKHIDYTITRHYEELAENIVSDNPVFEERKTKLQALRKEMLEELARLNK